MKIFIMGPTGVGKTKLSVELAKIYDAYIINCDAVQVYKGLDIGSAKVTEEEKCGIKHFLFDIKNPDEEYSVKDYQTDLRNLFDKYSKKNLIIVGGTGLYATAGAYDYRFNDEEKKDYSNYSLEELYKLAKEKFNSEFLFVTDFPAEKRAFYHMRDKDGILQGYDLIWRGVEITTGAQREHRYGEIVKNAKEKGLGEDVKFYLDFFKHGCPPHGGFAIGVDRLTMLLLGIPSVKESQFLFRGPNRLNP